MVWYQISHYEAELSGGQQVAHLVIVGVPRQPGLDDELVSALLPGDEAGPGDPDTGESHLLHYGRTSEPGVGALECTVTQGILL